jgi:hypothetical protein
MGSLVDGTEAAHQTSPGSDRADELTIAARKVPLRAKHVLLINVTLSISLLSATHVGGSHNRQMTDATRLPDMEESIAPRTGLLGVSARPGQADHADE